MLPRQLFHRILNMSLIFVMLLSLGSPALAQNLTETPVHSEQPTTPLVVKVFFDDRESLDQLAAYLDIWEVDHTAGFLIAMVTPQTYLYLQQQGYRVIIDQAKTDLLNLPNKPLPGQGLEGIPGYPCYRTVEETYTDLQDVVTSYPDLAELIDIGDSWDKVNMGGPVGYDLYALRLTNESFGDINQKPTFFLMAEIHAREYVTAETAMRYAEYLVNNYGINPDITWLLDYFRVYIVTMTNPDGRKFAEAGYLWRKNTDNIAGGGCSFPDYGVDLNRNHTFHWGGASNNPCAETYQGPTAGSEPETQSIQNFVLTLFPDQRGPGDTDPAPVDTTGLFISLHSYSQLVLWPWGWTSTNSPNHSQLRTLGRHMAYFNYYTPQQSNNLYQTTGTSDDWAYGELGVAAYTFEMGTTFFQGCTSFENTIYPNNLNSLLYAIKTARRPYMNPGGPDTLSVIATPNSVPAGTPVLLTAIANDTRFNNSNGTEPTQNINEARYSIDSPSWIDGAVTFPMTASDGSFNSSIENIEATVDTLQLPAGRHTIFVEGKDASGNWGVPSAVFLDITVPAYGVMLTPESASAQADPGQTITYTLQVNNIGLNDDTYDISITSLWDYTAPLSIGPLPAGANATFDVQVTIPVTATSGESDTAVVSVISQANVGVNDSSSLTSTANFYDLALTPASAQAQGYPGGQVSYSLHLVNLGNVSDTYTLQSSSLWDLTLPASLGPLDPGASVDFTVVVDVPPDALAGDADTATITAVSQGDASRSQSSSLTTTAIQAGPFVNPESAQASGNPGTSVVYNLQLSSHNYLPDTFSLSVATSWDVDYPLTVGPIPPDGSVNVPITVHVPAGAVGGDSDTATITFTSSIPGLPIATAVLTTTANNFYTFQVQPDSDTLTGYGRGSSVEYTVYVTNTGNVSDTYNIYLLSSDWTVDVPAHVGPLERGESASFTVVVHVPFDILMGDTNTAMLTVVSQGSSTGQPFYLHTNTFWYSNFLPLSIRN